MTWVPVDLLHLQSCCSGLKLLSFPGAVLGDLWLEPASFPPAAPPARGAAPQNLREQLGATLLESHLQQVAFCLGSSLWFYFDMKTHPRPRPHLSPSPGCLCCLFSFFFFWGGGGWGEGSDFVN